MPRGETGLRLIIGYKLAKAGVELLLAAMLTAVLVLGAEDPARALADVVRRHVTGAWSLRLTALLARAATATRRRADDRRAPLRRRADVG